MAFSLKRNRKTKFQRAADGSMSLVDHLRDLRGRMVKAVLAVIAGFSVGMFFAQPVLRFITDPFCDEQEAKDDLCQFVTNSPIDEFLLQLKVALFIGLLLAAPVWLYQLWAFIAPGLHKHERRYSYYFVAVAAPLFFAGAVLGHFVLTKSIQFITGLNQSYSVIFNLSDTFGFVTQVMLLFGVGLEFPLILAMLNVFGLVSAKRMLGWWRIVMLLSFLFCAIVTPTPDPFGMTALALVMSLLYFVAVGFAFLNDARRRRNNAEWEDADDDEASSIGDVDDLDSSASVSASDLSDPDQDGEQRPRRGYDDVT